MNAVQSTPAATVQDWRPFDDVYREFVEANPMLGLNASEFAATRLRQHYGEQLLAAGAALRLPNRRWLAHPGKFGQAVFEAMTSSKAEIIERAQARQAAKS